MRIYGVEVWDGSGGREEEEFFSIKKMRKKEIENGSIGCAPWP